MFCMWELSYYTKILTILKNKFVHCLKYIVFFWAITHCSHSFLNIMKNIYDQNIKKKILKHKKSKMKTGSK